MSTLRPYTNSFASGALIAAASFLIAPEALMILSSASVSPDGEAQGFFKWGSCLIAGVLSGALIHWISHSLESNLLDHKQPDAIELQRITVQTTVETPAGCSDVEKPKLKGDKVVQGYLGVHPVVWAVCLGDGLHNAVDGVTLAVAFSACSAGAGWIVLIGTVAHEIPQELADYLVLTQVGGLRPLTALAVNVLSGATAILAGLITSGIIVNQPEVDQQALGDLLAYSAGVYLWISVSLPAPILLYISVFFHPLNFRHMCSPSQVGELLGHLQLTDLKATFFQGLLPFLVGATAVGLVLLGHKHCEPEGGGGHGH